MQVTERGVQTNYNFNALMQRAADPEVDINDKFRILAGAMMVERQKFQNELKEKDREIKHLKKDMKKDREVNNAERKYNIEKTIDKAIKSFQNSGHAAIGGSIAGNVLLFAICPVAGLLASPVATGISIQGIEAYNFEQELRAIKNDPERFAALGSTSKEVKENIQKMWEEREAEREANRQSETSNIEDPVVNWDF